MPLHAGRKGKAFELTIAKKLAALFETNIRRTPCSGGMDFKGDIIATYGILSEYSWECKNQERLNIWNALRQSKKDSISSNKTPLVVFTKNHEDHYVAIPFDEFANLLKALDDMRQATLGNN